MKGHSRIATMAARNDRLVKSKGRAETSLQSDLSVDSRHVPQATKHKRRRKLLVPSQIIKIKDTAEPHGKSPKVLCTPGEAKVSGHGTHEFCLMVALEGAIQYEPGTDCTKRSKCQYTDLGGQLPLRHQTKQNRPSVSRPRNSNGPNMQLLRRPITRHPWPVRAKLATSLRGNASLKRAMAGTTAQTKTTRGTFTRASDRYQS